MQVKICQHINEIDPLQWNHLIEDNHPFLRHEFLLALENNGCVGEKFGWLPRHIALYDNDQLMAAMPLYEKYNSYGEFVFDNAWADAWQQNGLQYYPKLVSSIPYTPATGQRLLVKKGLESDYYPLLLDIVRRLAVQIKASGCHILFPNAQEQDWLMKQGLMIRHDCQFHWFNQNYRHFDDFLEQLSSRKRKNIIKERLSVKNSGVTIRCLNGHQATDDDWQAFSQFYQDTFSKKSGIATLNDAFFKEVAHTMPDQVLLVMAEQDNKTIAGALMYHSDTTLYGRFWGCHKTIKGLHFEACYYQGIEYCIKQGLTRFEPGAQGEHKVARGFVPTLTRSAHFLMEDHFKQAIDHFVEHEKNNVLHYIKDVEQHLPYKKQ